MNGSLARLALIAVFLQLSCNAALAVTWFDDNVRPDGACDSQTSTANSTANSGTSVVVVPAEEGTAQVVQSSGTDGEVTGDVFDSGD